MKEFEICKKNLDEKIFGSSTIRDYIKHSFKSIYKSEIDDKTINSWDDTKLIKIIGFFDNYWMNGGTD